MRSSQLRFKVRASRVRKKIYEISKRLRLTIYKSNKNMYAQIIDDFVPLQGNGLVGYKSVTLVSASTLDASVFEDKKTNKCNKDCAIKLSILLATKAKSIGITEVVFDRGGHKYHGILKSFAESSREAGLKF